MIRSVLLGLVLAASVVHAAAADPAAAISATPLLYTAQAAVLVLGALFTLVWAYQAFDAPPISFGDGPTLPRYMTQPTQYQLGAIGFSIICLLIYLLIAYFHQDLFPIVKYVSEPLYQVIQKSTVDGSLSYPATVIFAAAIFVAMLRLEGDWNPLLLLRRIIHGWVSIPELANALMVLAINELNVPKAARAEVVDDPDLQNVAIGDFDKSRRSLDRHWAELSYIRHWLNSHRAQGSHLTFFSEPSFSWEKLQNDYENIGALVGSLKQGYVNNPRIFDDVASKVDTLRRQYCRLAACFLVFKNENRKSVFVEARQFGVQVLPIERANPLRYFPIYAVAILVAVSVGVMLSATGWDLTHRYATAALGQDPDLITRWVGFALSNYGVAILVVLVVRDLGWRVDPAQPGSYVVSYATIFLLSLAIAAPCLALAVKFFSNNHTLTQLPYSSLIFTELKWSFAPAVVAVWVAHHLDRQIDPLVPDARLTEQWSSLKRLRRCVWCAVLATAATVPPALAIPAASAGSVSHSSVWEVDKVRVVILGTTAIIAFAMASVGEFFLGKKSLAPVAQNGESSQAQYSGSCELAALSEDTGDEEDG